MDAWTTIKTGKRPTLDGVNPRGIVTQLSESMGWERWQRLCRCAASPMIPASNQPEIPAKNTVGPHKS